jgi:hypothetical protein
MKPRPETSPERRAAQIDDDLLAGEFDEDAEAHAWLVKRIKAALEEADEAGYKRAMAKRF